MEKLEATFRIVTPLFLGGAYPNDCAELRPPSIKGLLRYWYRALDVDFMKYEPIIFGGTEKGQGQSIFLLSVDNHIKSGQEYQSNLDQKTHYFSFPINMGDNERKYIGASQEFTLKLIFRNNISQQEHTRTRRAIVATLWLLGHIGGLGTRNRRGFGTVSLQKLNGVNWDELSELSTAHTAVSAEQWLGKFSSGIHTLRKWFPVQPKDSHLVLGKNVRFRFVEGNEQGFASWDDALAAAAEIMRSFRNRKKPDYQNVKAHICKHVPEARPKAPHISPEHLASAPDRTAFGLPLTFRFSSLKYQWTNEKTGNTKNKIPSTTFQITKEKITKEKMNRSGSRIHLRIIKTGEQYYPLFCRFNGPLLGPGSTIKDGWGKYPPPSNQILDEFWDNLPKGGEVTW